MLHPAVLLKFLLGVEQLGAGAAPMGAVIMSAIVSQRRLISYFPFNFCPSSIDIAAPLSSVLRHFLPGHCVVVHGFEVSFHHVLIPKFLPSRFDCHC